MHLIGEAAKADIDGAEHFRSTTMKHILETFTSQNIYNADETVIYFRTLPESTYVEAAKKKCHRGFKTAKDRVTMLATCNMNGDKKKNCLLIGKFKSPRCFKRIDQILQSHTTFPKMRTWLALSFIIGSNHGINNWRQRKGKRLF